MKYTLIAIVLLIILGGVIYYVAPLSQENKDVYSSDENTATSSEEAPFTSDEEIGVLQDQPSTEDASVSSSITRDQLAAHNSKDNCWVAYKGIVYDITKWLPRHPGSSAAIEPYCGTSEEFTRAFTGQHGAKQEKRLESEGVEEGTLAN